MEFLLGGGVLLRSALPPAEDSSCVPTAVKPLTPIPVHEVVNPLPRDRCPRGPPGASSVCVIPVQENSGPPLPPPPGPPLCNPSSGELRREGGREGV